MNLPVVHHIYSSKPTAILLLIFMLIIPLSALAIPYVYTYKGHEFANVNPGSDLTTSDYITFTFTWDFGGPIPSEPQYTEVSVGPYATTAAFDRFIIYEWSQAGLPVRWNIFGSRGNFQDGTGRYVDMQFETAYLQGGFAEDYGGIRETLSPDVITLAWNNNEPGVWGRAGVAPVPEPATLILLGSGLLGLAATRKRKKN